VLRAAACSTAKPATTHWGSLELLPTLGNEIEVGRRRFVDTGEVITASGSLGRDRHGTAPGRAASPFADLAAGFGATSVRPERVDSGATPLFSPVVLRIRPSTYADPRGEPRDQVHVMSIPAETPAAVITCRCRRSGRRPDSISLPRSAALERRPQVRRRRFAVEQARAASTSEPVQTLVTSAPLRRGHESSSVPLRPPAPCASRARRVNEHRRARAVAHVSSGRTRSPLRR